jgi:ketosteroid isomerase-like protein
MGIPVTEKNVRAVIQKFLTAVETGNEKVLYEVYREDIKVWLNITNKTMSKQDGLSMLIGMRRAGVQLRYLLDEELIVGNKAVRRHRVEATMAGGQTLTVHVAMFVTVEGDQIIQLDEYLDSREIAALPAAVHTKIKGDSASPA